MAEGWAKSLLGGEFNFFSAGTKKHGMNERAITVMKEVGVDISNHESNTVDEISEKMDYVVTVCSDAHENCPVFSGGKVIHIGFDDPPRLTSHMNVEEEVLEVYRRVRDEIREVVSNLETYL
jgi:arsenate reductase